MSNEKYEVVKQKLQRFDLQSVAQEEFLILECYENASIPNKRLVFLDKKSSVRAVIEINKGTATPTPWTLTEQYLWFKSSNLIDTLVSLFKHSLNISLGESALVSTDTEDFETILQLFDDLCFRLNKEDRTGWPTTADVLVPNVNAKAALVARSQHRTFVSPKSSFEKSVAIESGSYNGIGFVYVMVNELYPKMVKIGFTDREPRIRAAELSIESGLDAVYQPIYAFATKNAQEVEKFLHSLLMTIRVAKEFFTFDRERLAQAFIEARQKFAPEITDWSPIFCYQKCHELYEEDFIGAVIDRELQKEKLEALKNSVNDKWISSDAHEYRRWLRGLLMVFENKTKEVLQDNLDRLQNQIQELTQFVEKTREMVRVSKPSILEELGNHLISGVTLGLWDPDKAEKSHGELKKQLRAYEQDLLKLQDELKREIDKPEIGRAVIAWRFANELLNHSGECVKTINVLVRKSSRNDRVGFIMQVTDVGDLFGGQSFAVAFINANPVMTDDEKRIAREDARYVRNIETPYMERLFKAIFCVQVCLIEQKDLIDKTQLPAELFRPFDVGDLALERSFEIDSFGDWFFSEWYKPDRYFLGDTFLKEIKRFCSKKELNGSS